MTTSIDEIAEMVRMISKSDSKIVHVKNPFKNYQMFTKADMGKTFRILQFRSQYKLKHAIEEIMEITKNKQDILYWQLL